MSDLPPPTPGQQPAWQPPVGPAPAGTPDTTADGAPRPFLPDPRAPISPEPAITEVPAAPTAPAPIPTSEGSPWTPATVPTVPTVPSGVEPAAPSATPDWSDLTIPRPAPDAGTDPTLVMPGIPAAGAPGPLPVPPNARPGTTATPGGSGSGRRSRVPAIVGAVVAIAVGAGAVLWVTRSGDDESADDRTDETDDTGVIDTTVAPEPTSPTTPPTTAAPVVLPTTPPTVAIPSTVAPVEPPDTSPSASVLPSPPVPPAATLYSDPTGWSIAVDPAWQFQQTDQFSGWFTGTGTAEFQDNVNVATEDLPAPLTLDEYVAAATAVIDQSATEVEIIDQRRFVGTDGVEVHVIAWTGAVGSNGRLAFIQAMTVSPTRAYVATFTSQPPRMNQLALIVGPYLATIRGT